MSYLSVRRWDVNGGLWVLLIVASAFCLGSMILNAVLSTLASVGAMQ